MSSPGTSYGCKPLPPDHVIFGRSELMAALRARAEKLCASRIQILVLGAGGTGKELLARWIHANSPDARGPFVSVNCAAIPGPLLESELFGYVRGEFTGARHTKPGRAELAHTGTLFLDEIGDLDFTLQGKLLHFLQDGTFTPLGDTAERRVEARVICATSKDLEQRVHSGAFRADLFHRINVLQLRLPRLRERCEDIPTLVEYYRHLYTAQFDKVSDPVDAGTMRYLQTLNWPGNIRELANVMARYVLIGADAFVHEGFGNGTHSKPPLHGSAGTLKGVAGEAIRELEKRVILEALRDNHWNRRKAAQALQISYRTLIYKIRNAGIARRGESKVS